MGVVTCPFCESSDIEDVAQWGGQIITRQARCRSCNTYFEVVREDFDDPPSASRAARQAGWTARFASTSRSLKRWILPVTVRGKSSTNSTTCGYS